MKAIETYYKGYRFRSRLEARWAVFFDTLRIQWEYETEGFEMDDGTRYLPDFYLPTFDGGMFAEVKPFGDACEKARKFARESKKRLWLCVGTPAFFAYEYYEHCPDIKCAPETWRGIPNFDQAQGENRMYACPGYENPDGTISGDYGFEGSLYEEAVKAARSARFGD